MQTRLTSLFYLASPIVLAPMALATGGALAMACARAGALALVGGGYGDLAWTQREHRMALAISENDPQRARLGVGFITWKLDDDASALDWVLDQSAATRPRAVMLSFGDPRPYAARISAGGARPVRCSGWTNFLKPSRLALRSSWRKAVKRVATA